jgi:hypothetical protein
LNVDPKAHEIFDGSRDRTQRQGQVTGAAAGNSGQRQAAEVRCSGRGMAPSGSFRSGYSRWPADVKGKPVKPVRSTLDIGCLTGLVERA